MAHGDANEEFFRDGGDVLMEFAERGKRDGEYVEAVEEVAAEVPGFYMRGEIAVRRGNDAAAEFLDGRAAETAEFAGFEKAEEFCLEGQRHLADFVEE